MATKKTTSTSKSPGATSTMADAPTVWKRWLELSCPLDTSTLQSYLQQGWDKASLEPSFKFQKEATEWAKKQTSYYHIEDHLARKIPSHFALGLGWCFRGASGYGFYSKTPSGRPWLLERIQPKNLRYHNRYHNSNTQIKKILTSIFGSMNNEFHPAILMLEGSTIDDFISAHQGPFACGRQMWTLISESYPKLPISLTKKWISSLLSKGGAAFEQGLWTGFHEWKPQWVGSQGPQKTTPRDIEAWESMGLIFDAWMANPPQSLSTSIYEEMSTLRKWIRSSLSENPPVNTWTPKDCQRRAYFSVFCQQDDAEMAAYNASMCRIMTAEDINHRDIKNKKISLHLLTQTIIQRAPKCISYLLKQGGNPWLCYADIPYQGVREINPIIFLARQLNSYFFSNPSWKQCLVDWAQAMHRDATPDQQGWETRVLKEIETSSLSHEQKSWVIPVIEHYILSLALGESSDFSSSSETQEPPTKKTKRL